MLCYTSEQLTSELEVTGPITVNLWGSSSGLDTDFTAKLVDVRPDGYAQNINDGIIRARYRESLTSPRLLTPGQPYQFHIDLWATSHVFKARPPDSRRDQFVELPRFDRNPNTGTPIHTETHLVPAQQTIYHDAERPSYITLPVIPR